MANHILSVSLPLLASCLLCACASEKPAERPAATPAVKIEKKADTAVRAESKPTPRGAIGQMTIKSPEPPAGATATPAPQDTKSPEDALGRPTPAPVEGKEGVFAVTIRLEGLNEAPAPAGKFELSPVEGGGLPAQSFWSPDSNGVELSLNARGGSRWQVTLPDNPARKAVEFTLPAEPGAVSLSVNLESGEVRQ